MALAKYLVILTSYIADEIMNDKTKLFSVFALGVIAGVAILKLLETDKGKEFVENAKDKANSAAENIKEKISKLESELADLVNRKKENNTDQTV